MQNGMIPAHPTPHNRPCFVPTSKILILPSKSGKTRHRLARRLVGRQVCRLGGWVVILPLSWASDTAHCFCPRYFTRPEHSTDLRTRTSHVDSRVHAPAQHSGVLWTPDPRRRDLNDKLCRAQGTRATGTGKLGTGAVWNGKLWHNKTVPNYAAVFEAPKPCFEVSLLALRACAFPFRPTASRKYSIRATIKKL